MTLTCVTAVFNAIESGNRENLIRCVKSVTALKTPHEHLIYDGGSTDGTVELLRELEEKIGGESRWTKEGDSSTSHFSLLTIHSEKDTGIHNALNKGVRDAQGEWFYVLGCDDCISRPEVMDRLLAEAGNSDIVVTEVSFEKPLSWGKIRYIEFDQILWHTPYCHQGALMRTESIRQVGGFDETFRINACYKQMLALHCRGAKVKYCTGTENRFAVFGVDGLSSTNRDELENDHKRLLCEIFHLDRNKFDGYRNRGYLPLRVFCRFLWSPDAALRTSSRAMFNAWCLTLPIGRFIRSFRYGRQIRNAVDRMQWRSGSPRVLLASQNGKMTSGAFRSCAAMARELRMRHHIDVIIVLAQHGDGESELQRENIPYVVIPSESWLEEVDKVNRMGFRARVSYVYHNHRAIRAWKRLILRLKPNLVHVNSMSGHVGGLAAISLGVPVIWHLRDLLEEDHGFTIRERERGLKLVSRATKLIAVSECVRAKYAPIFGAEKIVRIYNGVDINRFYCPDKKIFCGETVTFLFVGNFKSTKGHFEFSLACAELYRRGYRNFRVWFVGGGYDSYRQQCASAFASVGMEHLVTYWGVQSNPEAWLAKADVSFSCARCEAFGRIAAEAMLAGCLVIGSDTGGTMELIQDGETGFLFHYNENSFSNLPDKMIQALQDVEFSRRIAANGRAFALENLTSAKNADQVASTYSSIWR